jgi:hypothetical protein
MPKAFFRLRLFWDRAKQMPKPLAARSEAMPEKGILYWMIRRGN